MWSHGLKTEHSIANAYIQAITNARHFVYIENQVSSRVGLISYRLFLTNSRPVLHHSYIGCSEARHQ